MDYNLTILYKKKLVEALKAFDKFCTANELNYFACSGTALGAVRHKGFIPWDDDIDIYMLRKDYNRLITLREKLNDTKYKITELGDEGYIYPFAKFYDTQTTLVEQKNFPTCCIGVYIDIFALDEVDGNIEKLAQKKEEYERLFENFQLTYCSPSLYLVLSNIYHFNFRYLWKLIKLHYCSLKRKKEVRKQFIEYEKLWQTEEGGGKLYFHHAIYKIEKEIFEKKWFDSYLYLPFEDYKIRMNIEYDKYLSRLFGDYMTPPPVEKRQPHHPHYYLNLKEGLSQEEVKQRIKRGEYLVY